MDMERKLLYAFRGWIAFVAFMDLGTAFRSYIEKRSFLGDPSDSNYSQGNYISFSDKLNYGRIPLKRIVLWASQWRNNAIWPEEWEIPTSHRPRTMWLILWPHVCGTHNGKFAIKCMNCIREWTGRVENMQHREICVRFENIFAQLSANFQWHFFARSPTNKMSFGACDNVFEWIAFYFHGFDTVFMFALFFRHCCSDSMIKRLSFGKFDEFFFVYSILHWRHRVPAVSLREIHYQF